MFSLICSKQPVQFFQNVSFTKLNQFSYLKYPSKNPCVHGIISLAFDKICNTQIETHSAH